MTPEERAESLVASWMGQRLSLNQHRAEIAAAIREAVAAERERCAKIAEAATTGLTGFVESDRMEFAVKNMAKLRDVIARRIREGK